MARIAVVVITYNEESNIERCLSSLTWVDELIVMDSYSTDRTVELSKKYTPNVFQHEFDGDIPQRIRGFEKTSSDWLMYIDADEEVTPELKDEILHVIQSPGSVNGYNIPRKVSVLGEWIFYGGWYPDYTFRLFRRSQYRAEHAEVHGGFTVEGEKGTLKGFLNHYTYPTIETYVAKLNDYTSLSVSNKLNDNPNIQASISKIVLSPVSHFLRKYFSQKGYKDGFAGFVLAALGAFYTLSLYAKIWEYRYRQKQGETLPPITNTELQPHKRKYRRATTV